ncbi:MAG: hypothetical protein ACOCQD_02635 [archaeon]
MIIRKIENKNGLTEAHLYANKGEKYFKREQIHLNGKHYFILNVIRESKDPLDGNYHLILKDITRDTQYDFSTLPLIYIERVYRVDPHTITIYYDNVTHVMKYKKTKKCLKDFITLKNMIKEALHVERPNKLR